MSKNATNAFKRTKLACYTSYFTMSSVFSLPPILFITLREMYDISYTLLGTLILVNFFTQLAIDLIFTAFSKRFNIKKVVRVMPLITSLGLITYAAIPMFFPQIAYPGLLIGTVIFSVSAGLSEVLLSPIIAAVPSDNPKKDMSLLHSLYAMGVFSVVVVSTVFLKIFGTHNWMYLTFLLALFPIIASYLFFTSPMPDMDSAEGSGTAKRAGKTALGLAFCVGCIFFGSGAENSMSNWISGFMENSLHIDKTLGDILGMAMFAIILGIVRIVYAKYSINIVKVLLGGMLGASACYLVAGLSSNTAAVFVACILTGLFTSMLWPGSLIMMEEKFPGIGVAAYALMAAGGDLGASIGPQLMGIVIDKVSQSDLAAEMAGSLSLTAEQIGMKAGMVVTAIFPILGAILLLFAMKYFRKVSQ